jgi:hypothetical protein
MTDTRPFDAALFLDVVIDPDTANLNLQMIELLMGQPEWWIVGGFPAHGAWRQVGTVSRARQQGAKAPRALQDRSHKAARTLRPVSIASAAPAGHSAPMPIRNSSNNQKLGARPASRLQAENQAIEIINGFLPCRSSVSAMPRI